MDAIVVGAGPNGLAAALELARAGRSVAVYERAADVGGGARTAQVTLPGFHHDLCSAVHPLALGAPVLPRLGLERHGLRFLWPEIQAAHPLEDGTAVAVHRSPAQTAAGLGRDGAAYLDLVAPLVEDWPRLAGSILAPLTRLPRHPVAAARFGLLGLRSVQSLTGRFDGDRARALLAGMAAHSFRPLEAPGTGAFALVLALLGHVAGWPVARGGSGAITQAMRAALQELGGVVHTGCEIVSLRELPRARAVLLDVGPRQLDTICGDQLPARYRAALRRFRYGPGAFKLDYALAGPVPWRAPECHRAATVHLGATFEEIAAGERATTRGVHARSPFVLVAQPSLIDATRAPVGRHTLWAYCHVPNGSRLDMTAAVEAQIERFAPGFSELVLARAARGPAQLEAENPNCVGGDINGGLASLPQLVFRPAPRLVPYTTPNPRVFLCSASTPPGGGVHGMCGYHAARAALRGVLA